MNNFATFNVAICALEFKCINEKSLQAAALHYAVMIMLVGVLTLLSSNNNLIVAYRTYFWDVRRKGVVVHIYSCVKFIYGVLYRGISRLMIYYDNWIYVPLAYCILIWCRSLTFTFRKACSFYMIPSITTCIPCNLVCTL